MARCNGHQIYHNFRKRSQVFITVHLGSPLRFTTLPFIFPLDPETGLSLPFTFSGLSPFSLSASLSNFRSPVGPGQARPAAAAPAGRRPGPARAWPRLRAHLATRTSGSFSQAFQPSFIRGKTFPTFQRFYSNFPVPSPLGQSFLARIQSYHSRNALHPGYSDRIRRSPGSCLSAWTRISHSPVPSRTPWAHPLARGVPTPQAFFPPPRPSVTGSDLPTALPSGTPAPACPTFPALPLLSRACPASRGPFAWRTPLLDVSGAPTPGRSLARPEPFLPTP